MFMQFAKWPSAISRASTKPGASKYSVVRVCPMRFSGRAPFLQFLGGLRATALDHRRDKRTGEFVMMPIAEGQSASPWKTCRLRLQRLFRSTAAAVFLATELAAPQLQ